MSEIKWDSNLNTAGWDFVDAARDMDIKLGPHLFNNLKPILKVVIEKYLERQDEPNDRI